MIKEFKEFISQGDMVDAAVGLVLALAFSKVVDSFVNSIIMPIISLLVGKTDFSTIGFHLGEDGAFVGIGDLLNSAINFVLIGLAVFMVVKTINRMKSLKK